MLEAAAVVECEAVLTATAPIDNTSATSASDATPPTAEVAAKVPAVTEPPAAVAVAPCVNVVSPSVVTWRPQLWRGEQEPEAAKAVVVAPPPEVAVEEPATANTASAVLIAAASPVVPAEEPATTPASVVADDAVEACVCDAEDVVSAIAEDAWAAGVAGSLDASGDAFWEEHLLDFSDDEEVVAAPDKLSDKLSDKHSDKLSDSTATSAHDTIFDTVLGSWQDQRGSCYEVTFDNVKATSSGCTVQTIRPDGSTLSTRGLIRCGWIKGYSEKRITWQGQYILEPVSANEIRWISAKRGTRDKNAFRWTRVLDDMQASQEDDEEEDDEAEPVAKTSRSSRSRAGSWAVWRAVERPIKSPAVQTQAVPCGKSSRGDRWGQARGPGRWKVKNSW
jgi:hypothetical protein